MLWSVGGFPENSFLLHNVTHIADQYYTRTRLKLREYTGGEGRIFLADASVFFKIDRYVRFGKATSVRVLRIETHTRQTNDRAWRGHQRPGIFGIPIFENYCAKRFTIKTVRDAEKPCFIIY